LTHQRLWRQRQLDFGGFGLGGTANKDCIHMSGGDDIVYCDSVARLYGGDGSDIIHAGECPELMDGGEGDDLLIKLNERLLHR
jgi:hypothetical protein